MGDLIQRVVKWSSAVTGIVLCLAGAYGVVIAGAPEGAQIAWIGAALVAIAGGEEVAEIIASMRR